MVQTPYLYWAHPFPSFIVLLTFFTLLAFIADTKGIKI